MMIVGILPTLGEQHLHARTLSANPRYTLLNEQIFAARGEDLQSDDRRRRAAQRLRRLDRARGRVHELPAASARASRGLREALERGPDDRRGAARGRRELALLLPQGALAGDADRAVRAGDRHAPGGAQGPGRAPAGLVRRALDHVDLRPVRGERALLPGAAAADRRRGPCRGARARRHPGAGRAAAAQRHRLPLEPPGLRGGARAPARARREPRAAGRPDRRRHARQLRLLLRARARAGRAASGRSGRRCRSRPPRTTCTRARAKGSTRASTGRASATCRSTELVLRRLLPLAHEGLERYGVDPHARDRLLGIIERRCVEEANGATWQSRTFRRLTRTRDTTASRPCAG